MEDTLYIFGCGGHARSIVNALNRRQDIVLVDPNCEPGEQILGYETVKMMLFLKNSMVKSFHLS